MNRVRLFRELLYFLVFCFLVSIILLLAPDVRIIREGYSLVSAVLGLMIFSFSIYGPMRFFAYLFTLGQKLRAKNLRMEEEVK